MESGLNPVELARELRSVLARNAAEAERNRRLPDENIEVLERANLFKVMTPKRWGSHGAPLTTSLRTFAELAKGCGSTGWVAMIINGVAWWASRLPDEGQEEIFAEIFAKSPARICAAGTPALKGKRVEAGVRITGNFPFASGCWHSQWGGLGAEIEGSDGKEAEFVTAFAPMAELRIEDTWHVAGMCATGSNTLVAEGVFIPNPRVLR